MFDIKKVFVIGAVYLSAIIGAGFASGREIMTYFAQFGYRGVIGLVISCVLISFCGAKALLTVKRGGIINPHDLNTAIAGKYLGAFLTLCCGLFSYSAYIIMLSGIRQLCGGNILPVIIISICAYIVLCRGFGTLSKICGVCAPVIAVMIACVALIGSFLSENETASAVVYSFSVSNVIFKAFLFAGYNILTSVCMLGRCACYLEKKSTAVWGGILGGIFVFISAVCVFISLIHGHVQPGLYDMPVLALFKNNDILFKVVLLLAMILSAVSGLTGTCVFFANIIPEKKLGILLGIAAIPLAYINFGKLVDCLYPIFGIAGIFLIIVLALMGNKNV